MITDKQVTAAAGTIADSIGPLLMGNDLGKYTDLARLVLEAAEAAAWSADMEAAPVDGTEVLVAVQGTHCIAIDWRDDTCPFGDFRADGQWLKPSRWRHLPEPPEK